MSKINEIRFHGRGGQGAKTASDLLAHAALEEGKFIQAFPEYGPERAGAPMRSYVRISDEEIKIHCSVTNPEIVVVIDPTLLNSVPVTEGLGEGGVLLVNTTESPEKVRNQLKFNKGKVYTVDATKIAMATIGAPLPNTPMLGALLKATAVVSMQGLKDEVKHKFSKKLTKEKLQGNLAAIEEGYKEVKEG